MCKLTKNLLIKGEAVGFSGFRGENLTRRVEIQGGG